MFDWESLRFFIAIAHCGSLSAAARHLRVDHATVSRRLSALESKLQVRLVDRLPRSSELTAAGQQVLALASRMEEDAFSIERLAQAENAPLHGKVTISMPPVLATNFFANHLSTFAQTHPGIQLAIASQTQAVSLGRREADIAIRLFRPEEPASITRTLGTMPFALYASRDYVHASDPSKWGVVAYEARLADMPHQKWLRLIAGDRPIVCEVSDMTTQRSVVRSGLGIGGLPVFMGDFDPALQRLPFDGAPFSLEIWLVMHSDLKHIPLIRVVTDFIIDIFEKAFAVKARN